MSTPITDALRADISKGYNAVLQSHERLERANAKFREMLDRICPDEHTINTRFSAKEVRALLASLTN